LQEQFVSCELPLAENVLAGQSRHSLSSFAADKTRYLPAPQLVHEAPGSALYVPGTQALQPIPGVTVHAVADGIA